MNSIPTEEIKAGLYQYISNINTRYLVLIFKEHNKLMSIRFTRVPFSSLNWESLEVYQHSFLGNFYKVNTLVESEKENGYYIQTDES
jgi:hypothetical protein